MVSDRLTRFPAGTTPQVSPPSRHETDARSLIPHRVGVGCWLAWTLAAALPAQGQEPPPGVDSRLAIPLERRPYTVYVSVAFGEGASLTAAFRDRTMRQLEHAVKRITGRIFELTVDRNDWLHPADERTLEDLTDAEGPARFPVEHIDRGFVVTINHRRGGYDLAAREWCEPARAWGEVGKVRTRDRKAIPVRLAALIVDRFQPTFEVVGGDIDEYTMRVQAGALAPSDPTFQLVKTGQILAPFYRYLNKDRTFSHRYDVPVTYCLVDRFEYGLAKGRMITGFPGYSLGQRRRRVEVHGRLLKIRHPATRLRLTTQDPPIRPLASHRITLAKKTLSREDTTNIENLMTDRLGYVTVPHDPQQPLVWLYVNSGQMLVARMPYVPGYYAEDSIPIPDDNARLETEGRIQVLRTELVDTVARRAVLYVKVRKLAEAGKKQEGRRLMEDLKRLETERGPGYFRNQLTLYKEHANELARQRKLVAAMKLRVLIDETEKMLNKHLVDDKFETFKQEVEPLLQ